jgi:hypothetical protein
MSDGSMFRRLTEAEKRKVSDYFFDLGLSPSEAGNQFYEIENKAKLEGRPMIDVHQEFVQSRQNSKNKGSRR